MRIFLKDKVNILLEDCTKIKIDKNLRKTILIAGIGGKLSIRILENLRLQLNKNDIIILSAHNNLDEVRTSIAKLKYLIVEENLITDNSKFYEVLVLSQFKGEEVLATGAFKNSEKSVKIEYYKKCIKFYETKSKYSNDEVSSSYLKMYQDRLKENSL